MAAFPSGGMTSFLLKQNSWFKCFVDKCYLMIYFVGTRVDAAACHALGALFVGQSFYTIVCDDVCGLGNVVQLKVS